MKALGKVTGPETAKAARTVMIPLATPLRPEASHRGLPLLRHLPALRLGTEWDEVSPGSPCIVREPAAPVQCQPPAAQRASAGVGGIVLVPQVPPPSDTRPHPGCRHRLSIRKVLTASGGPKTHCWPIWQQHFKAPLDELLFAPRGGRSGAGFGEGEEAE